MLDCYGALSMDGSGARPNKAMFADGLHLSEQGYRVWADLVAAALAELDLSGNELAALPAALAGCAGLVTLNLAANRIARLDESLFVR